MQRTFITIGLLVAAGLIVWAMARSGQQPAPSEEPAPPAAEQRADAEGEPADSTAPDTPTPPPDQQTAEAQAQTEAEADTDAQPPAPSPDAAERDTDGEPAEQPAAPTQIGPVEPIDGLHVVEVTDTQPEPVLGSTAADKDNPYLLEASLTPYGAGLRYVRLSRHHRTIQRKQPYPVQQKLVEERVRTANGERIARYRYPMAAYAIRVNGERKYLYHHRWRNVPERSGDRRTTFALTLADGDGEPVLRIERTWRVTPERYDLRLSQHIENLSGEPIKAQFSHYGPADLPPSGGYVGDRRKLIVGYLQPMRANPERKYITTADFRRLRSEVLDAESDVIWPAPEADPARDLTWAAVSNRYFAAAVHGVIDRDKPKIVPLEAQYPTLRRKVWGGGRTGRKLALLLETGPMPLPAKGDDGSARSLDLELYAGPKDPNILKEEPAYTTLRLGELIVYNLGGFCAMCTFAWLADGLMWLLRTIHTLAADWGVAIIGLVAIVRLLLHPLTKHSQVNMMKMGKQMQAIQPEVERLKEKYKDDQQKLNQEMMNLYREKGVNPVGMGLGCLPMFLQMPIWIALYAVLYFAIELRHSPAFWGVFQQLSGGAWPFMADLSSQDMFIPIPELDLGLVTLQSINLLPFLMMGVFFLQQKYTTTPSTPQSEQAAQQQKMMKWMMMLFPLILYKAPCGLNLYIMTSTAVGVVESQRVRSHLQQLEAAGKLFEKKKPKEGGFMDRMMKAAEQKQKQLEQQQGGGKGKSGKGKGGAQRKKPRRK